MHEISPATPSANQHRRLENYRDLLLILLQKEIKVRYKNNVLGYLWSVGNPLAFALVYFFAFKVIMRVQIEAYPLVLLAGLFPWQWFANSVNSASSVFVSRASIIKKVNFPRYIIPLSVLLNHAVHFCFCLPIIVGLLMVYQKAPYWGWILGLPLQMGIQFMLLYGIALTLSSLNLFVRDIEPIASILTQFTFFFTPIVFTEDLIPQQFSALVYLNPVASLMINWRHLLVDGRLNGMYVALSLGYAVLFAGVGVWIYRRLEHRFAEVV
ncbi:ABC transporter permease [Leptolyngbya sp. AN02str]|uniref:ABC transporter permease n=1 Tax=Leptolyngbya sp. AN02str TaxID=3423363 RepID=UPI003D31BF9A